MSDATSFSEERPEQWHEYVRAPRSIHDAAETGDLARVARILDEHPDWLDHRDARLQSTPLHSAAGQNRAEVVDFLLSRGAQVDLRDYQGRTPLHWAAENACVDAAGALLRGGADSEARDGLHWTPLMTSLREYDWKERSVRLVNLLLGHGVQIDLYSSLIMGRADVAHQRLISDPDVINRSPQADSILWAVVWLIDREIGSVTGPWDPLKAHEARMGMRVRELEQASEIMARHLGLLDLIVKPASLVTMSQHALLDVIEYAVKLPHPAVADKLLDAVRSTPAWSSAIPWENLYEIAEVSPCSEQMTVVVRKYENGCNRSRPVTQE